MFGLFKLTNSYRFPDDCAKEVGAGNVSQCEANVNTGLQLAACSTILQTVTQAQIFDAYLFLMSEGSNTVVGVGESIVGITALTILFPAASAVDRYDRGRVCDAAGYAAALGGVMSCVALWIDSLPLLFTSMVVWGIHWELCNSASDCIFVDSLPIADRTTMISRKTVVQMISCSLGIAVQLCFFFLFGNCWNVKMCKIILSLGYITLTPIVMNQLLSLRDRRFIPVIARNFTSDDNLLAVPDETNYPYPFPSEDGSSETTVSSNHRQELEKRKLTDVDDLPNCTSSLTVPLIPDVTQCCSELPLVSDGEWTAIRNVDRDSAMLNRLTRAQCFIPYLVGLSDFIRAIGAGMTVKFFSLFFMNEYNFSPVHVTLLGIVYNLCIALFTEQANHMSEKIGRSMTSTIYQVVSLVLFFVLYRTYSLQWVVLIYLIRGSAGNAFAALDRAIVADTTTVTHRGKWMAVESLSHVTWSGSAFIGGMLSDVYDYRTTFLYTAFVYAVALIIYLPVVFLFPKSCDRPPIFERRLTMESGIADSDSDNTLRQTHEALYHSRAVIDSMSLSRARGASVTAPIAVEKMLGKEEYCAHGSQRRLTTCDVINLRKQFGNTLESGRSGMDV